MDGDGHATHDWGVSVPSVVSETKLHIIVVMDVLDRPVLAVELYVF
jgi:hypothetical protein